MLTVINKGISPLETCPVLALASVFHGAVSIIHASAFKLRIYMPIWPFPSLPPLSVNSGKCLQIQLIFFFCSFSCMPYFLKGTKIFSSLPLEFCIFIYTYYLFGTGPRPSYSLVFVSWNSFLKENDNGHSGELNMSHALF